MKTISIKSKKAENKLREDKWLDDAADCYVVYIRDAELAVELAEQEAEDRMRKRAMMAYCYAYGCPNPKTCSIEPEKCPAVAKFIQKLNEE